MKKRMVKPLKTMKEFAEERAEQGFRQFEAYNQQQQASEVKVAEPKGLKAKVVWLRDKVAELKDRQAMQNTEYRLLSEQVQEERSRRLRAEAIIDHFINRQR